MKQARFCVTALLSSFSRSQCCPTALPYLLSPLRFVLPLLSNSNRGGHPRQEHFQILVVKLQSRRHHACLHIVNFGFRNFRSKALKLCDQPFIRLEMLLSFRCGHSAVGSECKIQSISLSIQPRFFTIAQLGPETPVVTFRPEPTPKELPRVASGQDRLDGHRV
jgi:hypothetical protein